MSANKKSMPTDWIDPDDAPELTDAFFVQADEYIGTKLIARGRPKFELFQARLDMPPQANPKLRKTMQTPAPWDNLGT